MTDTLDVKGLQDRRAISKPTYESSVVQGLEHIAMTPNDSGLDRHVTMAIPNSLAIKEGSDANEFLKRSGLLGRVLDAGVKVTLSQGQTFISTQTGEEETTLLLDFEYTDKTDIDVVKHILLN